MRFELFSFSIHPKRYYDFSIVSFISDNGEQRYSLLSIWWTFMNGLEFDILYTYQLIRWLINSKTVRSK